MTSNRRSISEIETKLIERESYFSDLVQYLTGLQVQASKGTLDDAELESFLLDVVNIRLDRSASQLQDILQDLGDAARFQQEEYAKFLTCLRHADPRVSYNAFMLQVDRCKLASSLQNSVKARERSALNFANLSLGDDEFLKDITDTFRAAKIEEVRAQDVDYQDLTKILRPAVKKNVQTKSFYVYFSVEWKKKQIQIKDIVMRDRKWHDTHTIPGGYQLPDHFVGVFDGLFSRISFEAVKEEERTMKGFSFLLHQVEKYFEVQDFLREWQAFADAHKVQYQQWHTKKGVAQDYQAFRAQIEREASNFESAVAEVRTLAEKNELLTEPTTNRFAKLQAKFKNYTDAWPKTQSKKSRDDTSEELQEKFEQFQASTKDVRKGLETLASELRAIIAKKEKQAAALAEQKQQHLQLALQQEEVAAASANVEAKAFQEEMQRRRDDRKRQVEETRENKTHQQQATRKLLSEAKSSTLLGTASRKTLVDQSLLEAIDDEDLELLERIMKLRDVEYDQVCNFIEKKGGQIAEIGNGSSHKCFTLQKLYFEFSSHLSDAKKQKAERDAESKTEIIAPSVKGTVVEPHGGSHKSGSLSLFNLKRIREKFIKAEFIPDKIRALKASIAAQKLPVLSGSVAAISSASYG